MIDKIKEIVARELMVDEGDITLETDILNDLGADSLSVVDLAMALEDEFEIEMPDEELEGIRTVGDIVNYIKNNG
ncbi:MAG: acyl carrier protein [Clostridia bacterium]|nr:acyl carrier protein [Clostridia bacterium]